MSVCDTVGRLDFDLVFVDCICVHVCVALFTRLSIICWIALLPF